MASAGAIPQGAYNTFVSGLAVVSIRGEISGNTLTVTVPDVAMGQTYGLITSSDVEGTLMDNAVLFGPAIIKGMRSLTPAPCADLEYITRLMNDLVMPPPPTVK